MGRKLQTAAAGERRAFWLEVARLVLCSRLLDELEERELTPQGLVKYQFSAKGHELAQVLLAKSLNHPTMLRPCTTVPVPLY
ncbi:hypothetical protein HRbin09_01129 [bacterium HR09]|nr:hypothetical protein HRbin09_01129 [bacterium HR09]